MQPRECWPRAPLRLPASSSSDTACARIHLRKETLTCTWEAHVAYVSFRQGQFCLPSASATPGRLWVQCTALWVSTAWAPARSVADMHSSSRGQGTISWQTGEKGTPAHLLGRQGKQGVWNQEVKTERQKCERAKGPSASFGPASFPLRESPAWTEGRASPHSSSPTAPTIRHLRAESRGPRLVHPGHTALENQNNLFS